MNEKKTKEILKKKNEQLTKKRRVEQVNETSQLTCWALSMVIAMIWSLFGRDRFLD